MPPLAPLGVHRDPVRMRIVDILMGGMWIGACDNIHPKLAAPGKQLAKGIGGFHPCGLMVQGNFGGVVGDAPSRGETCCIRMDAPEIIEPELRVILTRIVFDEG